MRPIVMPEYARDGPVPSLPEEDDDDCLEMLRRFPEEFLRLQAHCVAIKPEERPTFEDVRHSALSSAIYCRTLHKHTTVLQYSCIGCSIAYCLRIVSTCGHSITLM